MFLDEKVALVTGASRGIGREIATTLGKKGLVIVGTATTDEGAAAITEQFEKENIKGAGYSLDVCNEDSIQNLINQVATDFGNLSILINNAGITRDNILLRMKSDQWDSVIDTNLTAVYRLSKTCLKSMLKARWGRIISITSVVGVTGNPGQSNYSAAKAGMIGLSKSLAHEVAAYGVTVNTVAPGFIDTDMTRGLTDKQQEMISARIPMKRVGLPNEVAAAVAFLASNKAAYITGQTLHVNGGMCMV